MQDNNGMYKLIINDVSLRKKDTGTAETTKTYDACRCMRLRVLSRTFMKCIRYIHTSKFIFGSIS
jgi:hypothetical protein